MRKTDINILFIMDKDVFYDRQAEMLSVHRSVISFGTSRKSPANDPNLKVASCGRKGLV